MPTHSYVSKCGGWCQRVIAPWVQVASAGASRGAGALRDARSGCAARGALGISCASAGRHSLRVVCQARASSVPARRCGHAHVMGKNGGRVSGVSYIARRGGAAAAERCWAPRVAPTARARPPRAPRRPPRRRVPGRRSRSPVQIAAPDRAAITWRRTTCLPPCSPPPSRRAAACPPSCSPG